MDKTARRKAYDWQNICEVVVSGFVVRGAGNGATGYYKSGGANCARAGEIRAVDWH
jgi:hypothetical protein